MARADPPAISIVMATYNRSRALACAIESARRQSFADWELIVVGDACADDSADVIARIADPRIRFINLERNWGEQAGPNNVGIAESVAPLVAFLNHDDIWLPNHLKLCREALLAQQADLVFGVVANITPGTELPLRFDGLRIVLEGMFEGNAYSPAEMDAGVVPASSMLVRRAVLARLRGWRLGRDCYAAPSQDLLFRAWRANFRIRSLNALTTIVANSGNRPGSYLHGGAPEQEWFLARAGDPGFAAELAAAATGSRARRPRWWLRAIARAIASLGINPRELDFRFRRRLRRGDRIGQLRKVRGLPALASAGDAGAAFRLEMLRLSCRTAIGARIEFHAGAGGARFLGAGWSRPEGHGVWSDGPAAELMFDFGTPLRTALSLEFSLRAFVGAGLPSQVVEVLSADGTALAAWTLGPEALAQRRLPVPAAAATASQLRIGFRFPGAASPLSLGLSADPRRLAMALVGLRIDAAD